ncbi:hypothetical protein DMC30DRAFT_191607 [Rhodotorula diobovata]|uniref:Uncharacterized protein n=1 Tax=Rhodotorula diobovata TaxID=5288 RepID=A0A5C5G8I8_9BASI|nr:hypothetical protein DMC30DRAFT_191607 [Rhodotorula diobovata]
MLDSLRPFPSRSPRGPRCSCDDDTPPLPPLPPHLDAHFATASPSPARPSLALDDPAFPATPTRPRPSLSTAPFAASSFATEESESEAVTLTAAPTSLAERSDGRSQIPSQAPWPERATKRVERGGGTGAASKLRRLVRKDSSPQKDEGDGASSWCLVKAVTGGYSSDQRVVGSTFVQHDLLILKPRLFLYDPPLHLLHLPYLRLPRIELLAGPAVSLTPRPASPTTPKRAERRSWGTSKGEESFVERALEIAVEERARVAGSQRGASAPVMVLRIYDGSSLQQTLQLPAASIQLVAAEAASSADCPLDKTPSTSRFPLPSFPLIHLNFEAGESLSLRPMSTLDLQRLLDILGEEDETSDLLYEGEMKRRKSIVDAAYRSHHDLPSCPPPSTLPPPPSSPVISLLPRPPVSRRRSLNDPPPVPRRPIFQKSATQVVLSRVPSSEDESASLDRAASAETLPSSGSKLATAPSSPALLAPATLTSTSLEGASSSSSGHSSHLPASASSSALVSTPGRPNQRTLAPPLGPPPLPPPRSALRPRSPFSVSNPGQPPRRQ